MTMAIRKQILRIATTLVLIGPLCLSRAALHNDEPQAANYENGVKSTLAARCFACHGALKQEAGLRLDTVASMLVGGESGPAIEIGAAQSSLIM